MKIDYVLDTNILIYVSQSNATVRDFMKDLYGIFGISVISYLEFTMGVKKQDLKNIIDFLNSFEIVDFDREIANITRDTLQKKNKNLKSPNLANTIIGATAEYLEVPLITNNPKDFKIFKNLTLLQVKNI